MWASLQNSCSLLNSSSSEAEGPRTEKARGGARGGRDEEHKTGKVIFRQLHVSRHRSCEWKRGQKPSRIPASSAGPSAVCSVDVCARSGLQITRRRWLLPSSVGLHTPATSAALDFSFQILSREFGASLVSGAVLDPDWRRGADGCVRRGDQGHQDDLSQMTQGLP